MVVLVWWQSVHKINETHLLQVIQLLKSKHVVNAYFLHQYSASASIIHTAFTTHNSSRWYKDTIYMTKHNFQHIKIHVCAAKLYLFPGKWFWKPVSIYIFCFCSVYPLTTIRLYHHCLHYTAQELFTHFESAATIGIGFEWVFGYIRQDSHDPWHSTRIHC